MDNQKMTKQQFFDIEGLLQNLREKDGHNTKSDEANALLVDKTNGSQLIRKPHEVINKSTSRELVRYHSIVELGEFEDDYGSCKDSTENVNQLSIVFGDSGKQKPDLVVAQSSEKPSHGSPGSIQSPSTNPRQDAHNAELSNFVQKKSIAQGMMDLALVSANTNQLRYVMDIGERHPYFYLSMGLIITSLAMQLIVGLALIYNSRFNIRKRMEMKSADRINDLSVIGVFLITLVNVFISTFNGASSAPFSGEVIPMSIDVVTTAGPDVGSSHNGTIPSPYGGS
ncbi:ninjurin-A-like [Topomyia yanbarensis]|uniref:ninjurin-A-like n=1 Tax=Topomyia yanbarensis TaxID=2498891 RepID=UPI00273B18C9|nr:ninjurin-A-like [Topomyia yanbarensis]